MQSPAARETDATSRWLSLPQWSGIFFALWLLFFLQPYHGIRHDSVLYLGQALALQFPDELGQDMFFAYGSQARYTLFPWLMAALLEFIPAADLFAALTFGGRVAFLAASYALIRQLLPPRYRYWCLLAVLLMPPGYGARYIFAYGEAFLTARTLAEPIVLLAIVAALRHRWGWCAGGMLIAIAIHPPQAIPAAALLLLLAIATDRRNLLPLAFFAIAAALALANDGVRSALLQRYDADWLAWASDASPQVFVTQWRLRDWCHLLTDAFLVALTYRAGEGSLKTFAGALLLAAAASVAATALLADYLHLVLPTGLQPWRTLWLVHWFAIACIPMHLARLHAAGIADRPRLAMLLAIAVMGAPIGYASPPWGVLLLIPLYLAWPRMRGSVGPDVAKALVVAIGIGLLLFLAKFALALLAWATAAGAEPQGSGAALRLAMHPVLLLPVACAMLWAWKQAKGSARGILVVLLLAGTIHALIAWDARTPQDRFIEGSQGNTAAFGAILPHGAQVIWTDHLLATWLVLGRPNYLSEWQMSGLIFNRGTAETAESRATAVVPLGYAHSVCRESRSTVPYTRECPMDERVVRDTCAGGRGTLSHVVMPYPLRSGIVGTWTVPGLREGIAPTTYHLYSCAEALANG